VSAPERPDPAGVPDVISHADPEQQTGKLTGHGQTLQNCDKDCDKLHKRILNCCISLLCHQQQIEKNKTKYFWKHVPLLPLFGPSNPASNSRHL